MHVTLRLTWDGAKRDHHGMGVFRAVLMAGIMIVMGCVRPNPASCADGTCTDPSLPFCDVDGTIAGIPETCIAVECAPKSFEACRGDEAVVCNAFGTDFDLIQCEFGCDSESRGCRACETDNQCNGMTPICDALTDTCRECQADDECSSLVCDVDNGGCVAASEIVYASPGGNGISGPCSPEEPCSLSRAISIASENSLRSIVRLLPGPYTTQLNFTDVSISLVGTGATHQANGPDAIRVGSGASITIRGLELDLSRGDLNCDPSPNTVRPSLILRQLKITEPSATGTILAKNCSLSMDGVEVLSNGSPFFIFDNTGLSIDRSRFVNQSGFVALFGGLGVNLQVTVLNSIIENSHVGFEGDDQSRIDFAFNTVLIDNNDSTKVAVDCDYNTNMIVALENNILAATDDDAIFGSKCDSANNVLLRQMVAVPGSNIVADPLFVDVENHDVNIAIGSPAIDAAMPSANLDTDHDFAGRARPAGAKDIGAFELD